MGRLVEPPRRVKRADGLQEGVGGGEGELTGGDSFMERVVKYVPAEILAGYMTIDRMVAADAVKLSNLSREDPTFQLSNQQMIDVHLPEIVFISCLLLIFVYFKSYASYADNGDARTPWLLQAIVSALAFIVWTYAMRGGIFTLHDVFVEKYAAMLLPTFTILSGMVRPSPATGAQSPPAGSTQRPQAGAPQVQQSAPRTPDAPAAQPAPVQAAVAAAKPAEAVASDRPRMGRVL